MGKVTSEILVDGQEFPENYKRISAYVMQDDALISNLTVFETLMYSAALRLPSTYEEREKIVNKIIQVLGLKKVAHTRIGNQLKRGILLYYQFLIHQQEFLVEKGEGNSKL